MTEQRGCLTCRWAEWKRTAAGHLHPDGTGHCTYKVVMPILPNAFYYVGTGRNIPAPTGGSIDRKHNPVESCPTRWEEA